MEFTKKNNRVRIVPYIFVGPAIIYLIVVTVIPALMALPISLTDWTALSTKMNFVGLDNYKRLLGDELFGHSLVVMVKFFLSVPLVMAAGMILSVLLNHQIKGMTAFRVIFYSPVITSTIAAAVIFDWFFQPTFGLFNSILGLFGLPALGWIMDARTAVMSIILFKIWKTAGYAMLIYMAGLQDIPITLIEAADIDGASWLKKFLYITFPMLKPANVYLLIYLVIQTFMIFQETYVFVDLAPLRSIHTVVNYIYEKGFHSSEMGYASAMSFVLFAAVLVVTLLQYKFLEKDPN